MPVFRTPPAFLLLGILAVLCPALPASAVAAVAAPGACLGRADQRAAVLSHKAVPLAVAIKSLREHGHRAEVVRAELCQRGDGLVYVLTLLAHNGKVTRASVDAANGQPINGR